MIAAVLLSGGLDSTTVMYQAMADGAAGILAVSADYGSRHNQKELISARMVVAYAQDRWIPKEIRHQIIEMPDIFAGGRSALMGDVPVPQENYNAEGESVTVVPFRNANLISTAVTLAEVQRCDRVYAGMHASDHNRWAYPDCSPEFLGAMANAAYVGTLGRVRLVFPFVWMTKAEVVTRGALLGVPFSLTWSCYMGGEKHCGKCPTCLERIAAFIEAGYGDSVPYAVDVPFVGLEDPDVHN